MVRSLSIVFSIVAVFLFSASAATVSGTVTNSNGGAVIAGATVTLTPFGGGGTAVTATTNDSGDYTFTVTAANYPAIFTVSATAQGFQASAGAFVRVQNTNSNVTSDIRLDPRTAGVVVSGRVTIAGGNTPITGAKVVIRVRNGGAFTRVDSAVTNTSGNYSIDSIQPGTYGFLVTASGYNNATVNGVAVANANVTQNFQLTAVTYDTVRGTVTIQGTNTGIAGAQVVLLNGTARVDSATTAANGSYVMPNVASGQYVITVSKTGYTTYTSTGANPVVVNGQTVVRNVSLTPVVQPTTIMGVVTNANNSTPVVGAKVVLLSGLTRTDSTVTIAGGLYSFANIAAGTYSTITSATGYVNRTTINIVVAGTPVTSNVSLTPITSDTVRGTVTIQGSTPPAPIAGAKVVLSTGTARIDSAITNASGVYVMPAVASGTYGISVSATGYTTYTSGARNPVVVTGSTVVRDVALTALPQPTTILGVVSNAATSVGIPGAKVVLLSGAARIDSTMTATGGIYSFANVAAGTYSTITSATGFTNRTTNNIIVAGTPVTVNVALILITYDTVSGLVRIQGTTTGIPGATLILVDNNGVNVDTVTSGANGAYMFVNVASGTYVIVTSASGYVTANTNITVTTGPVTQNISLTARALGASALGTVEEAGSGDALEGAKVVLEQRIGGVWTAIDSTIAVTNGLYIIDSIQVGGNYRLVASMTGYVTTRQNITVTTNGSTITANFALNPTVGIVERPSIAAKLAPSVSMTPGYLTLSNINGAAEISVLRANGKVVFHTAIAPNTTLVSIPGSKIAAGTYIVNIARKSGVLSRRVIVR